MYKTYYVYTGNNLQHSWNILRAWPMSYDNKIKNIYDKFNFFNDNTNNIHWNSINCFE